MTQKQLNQLTYEIMGCAIEVHKLLGPGLLESIYEDCFCEELSSNGFMIIRQKRIPVVYKTKTLNIDFKLDVLVEDIVICELKAIESIAPVHEAQILSYMKLLQKPKGLLINFHSDNIVKNTRHFVNEYFAQLPKE